MFATMFCALAKSSQLLRLEATPAISMDLGAGQARKQPRGALLVSNLPSLQNLLKRDPKAYREDFLLQWNAYQSLRKIVELGLEGETSHKARETEQRWRELVGFIAQVAHLYKDVTAQEFPAHLSNLLLHSNASLSPETRKTLIQSLVLLRNRDMIPPIDLLKILFPLLGVTSSPNLRSFILKTILSDIKNANLKSKNHKLNRTVQGLLFSMVERGIQTTDGSSAGGPQGTGTRAHHKKSTNGVSSATAAGREAMLAVKIASELWRKQIWNDAKTVQLVSLACFHSNTKVASAAMHFFLANEADDTPDSDDDGEADLPDFKQMYHQGQINKSRRSTVKKEKKMVKQTNNKRKRLDAKKAAQANFAAIHLLLDPQSFAERLYEHLLHFDKQYTLEHRVLMMQLFGRVTGTHQCTVLGFYSYATRFLNHHQTSVTAILVAVAQSVHELTPPDVLTPVIRKLASEFVHPGVGPEVIAAGLNAIREVCRRQPLGMDRDLLEDLVEYKKSRDKGIMVASRSLLQLYREVDPGLLKRKERGKVASTTGKDKEQRQFGQRSQDVSEIEGLNLLAKHKAERHAEGVEEEDEEDQWKMEEDQEDDGNDTDGWINVSSDEEKELHISDSDSDDDDDDADGKRKRRRKQKQPQIAENENEDEEEETITFNIIDDSDDDDGDVAEQDNTEGDGDDDQEEVARLQNLAAQQILTPADFAKLNDLQTAAAEEEAKNGGGNATRRKLAALAAAKKAAAAQSSEFLTEAEILGQRKKGKADYEERMASIQRGREGREKFGSNKGKKKNEKSHSTTNDEKRRSKNFMMARQSRTVRTKKAASLQEKQKKLRAHVTKQKKKMK